MKELTEHLLQENVPLNVKKNSIESIYVLTNFRIQESLSVTSNLLRSYFK